MPLSRQDRDDHMTSGRVRQKARTRAAILEAAAGLARAGRPPSVADAAEAAGVSPATAYRYFPTARSLWEEATFAAAHAWDPASVEEAGDAVAARLERAVTTLGWLMLDEEAAFRLRARAGLETWFGQAGVPDEERVPVREGRRTQWNEAVVAPLRGRLTDAQVDDLVHALALVWGPEAVISLRDVCRLDAEEAKRTMLRAARWMLAGAMADYGLEGDRAADAGASTGGET